MKRESGKYSFVAARRWDLSIPAGIYKVESDPTHHKQLHGPHSSNVGLYTPLAWSPAPKTVTMSIEMKTADSSLEKRETYDVEELSNAPSSPQDESASIDEKKLIRKIDFVLIPWLSFLYLVAFLDRSSIGNAKVSIFLELARPYWYDA